MACAGCAARRAAMIQMKQQLLARMLGMVPPPPKPPPAKAPPAKKD